VPCGGSTTTLGEHCRRTLSASWPQHAVETVAAMVTPDVDGGCDDCPEAVDGEMEADANMKDGISLHRIQQIGRTVASAASVGLVYLCVSLGLFSSGLDSWDRIPGAEVGSHAELRRTPWRQMLALCIALAIAGFGVFLVLCPGRCLGSAIAASSLSRGSLRSWWPTSISFARALNITLSCSLFMVVGPALMLVNKHVMQGVGFHYPLSLGVLGLGTCAVCSRLFVLLGFASVRTESLELVSGRGWYQIALPIGLCKAMTLATGNAVYLHLGLGFIQMLKAFTPVVVLVAMRIFGITSPSPSAVGFVFIIVLGTLVEVKGELHPTGIGLLLMFTSEAAEAVNLVLTQKLLQNNKFSVVEGLYVLAPPGAMALLCASVALEWPRMIEAGHHRMPLEHPVWFAGAAILGVLVNFAGFLVVQATSSLTIKILNTARCVGLVLVGVVFYGEILMPLELVGYTIALAGFVGYNLVQMFPERGDQFERMVSRRCCGCCLGHNTVEDSRD